MLTKSITKKNYMDATLQKSFGKLDIKFEKNSLKKLYQQGASKAIIPNSYRRFKELVLVNTSGGMTSGDSYLNNFNLSGSDICITTQTAEKIYSGFGQPAKLKIDIDLNESNLLWLPQELILFNQCNFSRRINININNNSNLIMSETTVYGRTSMGEVIEKGFFSDIWEIFCEGKLVHVEASGFDGNISKLLNNRTTFDNKYAVNTILVIGKLFYEKIKNINVEKFENDEVKIAMSEWDNKVLIRSIGTNSYYLKFAIMGLLSYILDNEIPKVWNS